MKSLGHKVYLYAGEDNEAPAPAAPVAPAAPTAPAQPASTLSPEQLAYNQLRAQLDSADSLRGDASANTFTDISPEVVAGETRMRTKLAQMAATLQAKGIDAAAEYDAPDPAVPAAAPVDLAKKYGKDLDLSPMGKTMLESQVRTSIQDNIDNPISNKADLMKPTTTTGVIVEDLTTKVGALKEQAPTVAGTTVIAPSNTTVNNTTNTSKMFPPARNEDSSMDRYRFSRVNY